MQFQIKQREKALEIARNRELFIWMFGFYVIAASSIVAKFYRVKRPAVLTPLIPMSFVLLYVGDLGYGSKIHRIHAEAEMIMDNEHDLLNLPGGLPTVASIDAARAELEEERLIRYLRLITKNLPSLFLDEFTQFTIKSVNTS